MFEVGSDTPFVTTFEQMVTHFESVADDTRHQIAQDWQADGHAPEDLADAWMRRPDELAEHVVEAATQAGCRPALSDLVFEHSLPLEPTWLDPQTRIPIANLGLLPDITAQETFVFPDGLAAALSKHLQGRRPSLAVLLGRASEQRIDNLLDVYDLDTDGSWLRRASRIIDTLSAPDALDLILDHLPSEDWLGPALMVLELGGTCYWREVFGVEAEGQQGGDNVVALMGADQRDREREIADRLIDLGLIVKLDEREQPWPMIAVPEELWPAIWQKGRRWVGDWLHVTHQNLTGAASEGAPDSDPPSFQSVAKWLACETVAQPLGTEDGQPDELARQRLDAHASEGLSDVWPRVWDLALESSVLSIDEDRQVDLGRDADSLLNSPSRDLSRGFLYEWCSGYLGGTADRNLNQALGVDETWRQHAAEMMRGRQQFRPLWFNNEGVDKENTGAGCLRNLNDNEQLELVLQEIELLTTTVWRAKLLWLDLLTLLPDERWYHESLLADLLRMCAAMSMHARIGQLAHDPRAFFYIPAQRPSLLNSPLHLDEFDLWTADILDHLLEPLGLVHVGTHPMSSPNTSDSPDDSDRDRAAERSVWFDTPIPIIDSPASWAEEDRRQLLEFIFGEEINWRDNRNERGGHLSAVKPFSDDSQGERVDLSADLQHLLDRADGRKIRACDAETLWLETQ
jgi:hypothetical protein